MQQGTAKEPRATHPQFSWNKGILTAHKPPTRRLTPTATQQCRTTKLASNISKVAVEASNIGTQSALLQKDHSSEVALHLAYSIAQPMDPSTSAMETASCTNFLQRYDVRVCLYSMKGKVFSKWEGITTFFQKMREFDDTIWVLPWHVKDHNDHNPQLDISSIPHSFFNQQTYVPCLAITEASWTTRTALGRTRHPFLYMCSSISPDELVTKMGPWLQATKQGLWPRQLALTEETKCLGWLLYSAPEYHLSNLRHQIKLDTGIDVALRFRRISDGRPAHADHSIPRTKAIHMEVDLTILPKQQQRLERTYSSTARTFPLGIKMRLIPELGRTVNTEASANAAQLIKRQASFLAYTRTSRICSAIPDPSKMDLVYQTLRTMTVPSGPANCMGKPLFHAISPMATKEGYLVRYLLQ